MTTFLYPNAEELRRIEAVKLPNLQANRPIFDIMPITDANAALLRWTQQDNFGGLQQFRGLDGKPPRISRPGAKTYLMSPGVYGEFDMLDETELTMRAQYGQPDAPVSLDDLVMEAQDRLLGRRLDRIEKIGWDLLQGTFSVASPLGGTVHTDSYSVQTYTATTAWATVATATPIKNFQAVNLLARGYSTNFGAGAKAYMNQTTFNSMIQNTNSADLGGKFSIMGTQPLLSGPAEVNRVLMGAGLPEIVVYEGGYVDDNAAWQLFIPNNVVIVVGARSSGARLAEYRMVRNVNNPGMAPGAYTAVIDRGAEGAGRQIPRTIEVHDGHNGGPVIFFPGSIVVMSV